MAIILPLKKDNVMKKSDLRGSFLLLITAVIWGLAFVVQDSVGGRIGEYTLNASRFIVAAVFLIPCIMLFDLKTERRLFDFKNRRIDITKKEWLGGALCGIALAVASVLQQIGISRGAGAGVAGFLTSLYVVIVPFFGIALGRKTSAKNWICTLVAIFGVFLISYSGGGFSLADIFVLICAVAFAIHITVIDVVSPGCDGVRLSLVQFITGAAVTLPFAIFIEHPSASAIGSCLFPIIYLGVMSSGIAYTLQIIGQKKTSPAVASIIMSLESVFAAIGGVLIAGEDFGWRKFFGCLTVFISVIITQIDLAAIFGKFRLKKQKSE